jgi:GH24 family phage-related lysozyme (muramidase)
MGKLYKILHWEDQLVCNHGGKVVLNPGVEERNTEIQTDKRIVTEHDLLTKVTIKGCGNKPVPCTKITQVVKGRAKDLLAKGEIPVLGNLVAKTDQATCLVRWKKSLYVNLVDAEVSPSKKLTPGFDDTAYTDSKGILTVGVGHNVEAHPVPGVTRVGDSIDVNTAGTLFDADQARAESEVQKLFDNWQGTARRPLNEKNPVKFDDLTPEQQQGLTDLDFNMGPGVAGGTSGLGSFTKFMNDMRRGDFDEASRELGRGATPNTPSGYVTDVGPNRSGRVMREIRGLDGGTEAFAKPE